ncbi:MAG: RagB/SusD family nutrient uptake outer membrane protein [Chitinophagaceae bacterium]|nr:MAG: RagB/SusD family nutrient uptake outer membrane protein [Chitinophagaceae bacterium]
MKQLPYYITHPYKASMLFITALVLIGISCNRDILDKRPLDAISEDAVFEDATFLQNYVYNVYNGMRAPWSPGTGGYETLTDVAVYQPETHDRAGGIRQYLDGNMTPDNVTDLTGIWNEEYSYIRKANIFFEKVAESTIATTVIDPMKGEMHFLQAWMYFDLMRHFGGVPIIENSFSLDDDFALPRNTFDECATYVLSNCDQAIQFLDGIDAVSGKISHGAALALKARILLYLASPLNNPSNDLNKWRAAETATKAVIDAGYSLHATHEDLFKRPLKTDEIILGRQFTPNTRIPDWGFNYDYWPSGFDARQRIMPTQTFVNMFQLKNGQYAYQADGVTVNPLSGYDPQNPNIDRDPRYYSAVIFPGAGPFNINDGAKSTVRTYEYWEDANPNASNNAPYANPNKVDPKNGQNLFDFGRDSKTFWVKGLTPFHWRVQTGYTFRRYNDFAGPRASYDYDYSQAIVFLRLAEFL